MRGLTVGSESAARGVAGRSEVSVACSVHGVLGVHVATWRRLSWWHWTLVVASCGGGGGDGDSSGGSDTTNPATIVEGGEVTYALEAETSGGYCFPEAQLAASGMIVTRAIYDLLIVPSEGEPGYSPYLLESLEQNEDATVWTLKLREGIKFHDGTDPRLDGAQEQHRFLARPLPRTAIAFPALTCSSRSTRSRSSTT